MPRLPLAVLVIASLSACGGSSTTTVIEDVVRANDPGDIAGGDAILRTSTGGYLVTYQGQTFDVGPGGIFNGQEARLATGNRYASYRGGDVFAIGGIVDGESFAAVNGVAETPTVGDAIYEGRYALVTEGDFVNANVDIRVSPRDGTLTVRSDDFTADAALSATGETFTGDVSFTNQGGTTYVGDMDGIFATRGTPVGAFAGEGLGGVLYGGR